MRLSTTPFRVAGLTQIKDERNVFHNSRELHHLACAQVPGQRCSHHGGRLNTPHYHADWAPATCAKGLNWYLVTALSTGDILSFLLHRMLTSFKCIMWIALAALAEVPLVVRPFPSLNNTGFLRQHSSGLPKSRYKWCVSESLHPKMRPMAHSALIDAWNGVWFSSVVLFQQWLIQLSPQMFGETSSKPFQIDHRKGT